MDKRTRAKLNKIIELARCGVDGEKQTAQKMLNAICEKHGLDMTDLLNGSQKKQRVFKVRVIEIILLNQIMDYVLPDYEDREVLQSINKNTDLYIELTDLEDGLIRQMFAWHSSNFRCEKKQIEDDLMVAYIQKHNLFGNLAKKQQVDDYDIEKAVRRSSLRRHLSDRKFTKLLN